MCRPAPCTAESGSTQNRPALPTSLTDALTGLRTALRQARADGRLDNDTYTEAEAELTAAQEALKTDTPQSGRTLMLALKKVRGLIGDVADLAAKAAVVIALAQGLS